LSIYNITFNFKDVEIFPFPEDEFRKWIFHIIKGEKKKVGFINYILCNDQELHEMNLKFLQHDTLTDVITFDYSEDFKNISGDIFISIDRIKENALELGITFEREFARILCHGILHICGYDDKDVDSKGVMTIKENHYLNIIDFL
jgi:probable rRNA maturation factor